MDKRRVTKTITLLFIEIDNMTSILFCITCELVPEHWNLLRKAFPNLLNGLNCFFGSTWIYFMKSLTVVQNVVSGLLTTRALPGTTPSESACMTAMNLVCKRAC